MEHIECGNAATGIKINPFDGVRIYDRRQYNSLGEWDRRVAMVHAQQVLRELKDLAYLVNFIRKHGKQEQMYIAKSALADPNLARGIMIAPSWNDDWTPAEKGALRRCNKIN
jgi:hypothetical protein